MTVFLLLTTVVIISLVQGTPVTKDTIDSCDAQFYSYSSCSGTISSTGGCKASTLNLGNTIYSKKKQAYTIYVDHECLNGAVSHVYRLFNGQETEVTTTNSKLIQYSDANYQVILKLQGPPRLTYYGVFINYEVTDM